jgi:hypothetical protein
MEKRLNFFLVCRKQTTRPAAASVTIEELKLFDCPLPLPALLPTCRPFFSV